MTRKLTLLLVCAFEVGLILSVAACTANAEELWCKVTRKLDSEREYSRENLDKHKPGVFVRTGAYGATLSRCSYGFSGKHSCDEYAVDKIEIDNNSGHRKFYYYRGQFDVQVFSNNRFIENNGRGTISFGQCWVQ
ncbi:hypothetical protein N9L55_03065 [Alphaproteobacteria bacterium]|nr:hypothetical protein [Alphaproteobacteria bacterium]